MKNDFLFIFLAPAGVFILLNVISSWPSSFYWSLAALTLLLLISLRRAGGKHFLSLDFWLSSILPLLFVLSVLNYSLILTIDPIKQLLFVVAAIFTFYYMKNVGREGNGRFLENVSSYGGFLTIFFSFSFFYALKAFLGVPIVYLVGASMFVLLAVVAEVFWANRISFKLGTPYLILVSILLIQLAWSLYFLSLEHDFLGLTLAICYYMIIGIVKPFLRGALSKKTVKLYLICGLASIVAVLLSAKWL